MLNTTTIRIGLRFDRRDARTLRALADRAAHRELGANGVQVFQAAAEAATTGEPLIVECQSPLEARLMASGYVRFGVRRPVLEQLN